MGVFARNNECRRCHTPRPADAVTPAVASREPSLSTSRELMQEPTRPSVSMDTASQLASAAIMGGAAVVPGQIALPMVAGCPAAAAQGCLAGIGVAALQGLPTNGCGQMSFSAMQPGLIALPGQTGFPQGAAPMYAAWGMYPGLP